MKPSNLNHNYINKADKTDQHIVGMILLFSLFMPNGTLFYSSMPIIVLFLIIKYFRFSQTCNAKLLVILSFTLALFISFFFNENTIEIKTYYRNLSLLQLFLFFPFVKNVKIPNEYLYIALIYIFISQISYMIGVKSIISFFNEIYPSESDKIIYNSEYLIKNSAEMSFTNRYFRLGGLYHNPNQCGRFLNIVFITFLIENYKKTFKKLLPFIIIYTLAILATGSRTAFFISALSISYYIYFRTVDKKSSFSIIFLGLFIFVLGFLTFIITSGYSSELRFLDYKEGLDSSLFVKIKILVNYVSRNNSWLHLLFGNFSNEGIGAITFDSEWGELIYRYGFVSIISFFIFYISVVKTLSKKNKLLFLILLWTISSTILMSFRMSFVFIILLSKYYSEDFILKKT